MLAHVSMLTVPTLPCCSNLYSLLQLANGLDARLDAREAAQDQKEREEGTRMREAFAKALASTRASLLRSNKKRCADIRKESAVALQHASEQPRQHAALLAGTARQASALYVSRRQQNEEEYLAKARVNKERAREARMNAKANFEAMLSARKREATKERNNDHVSARWPMDGAFGYPKDSFDLVRLRILRAFHFFWSPVVSILRGRSWSSRQSASYSRRTEGKWRR